MMPYGAHQAEINPILRHTLEEISVLLMCRNAKNLTVCILQSPVASSEFFSILIFPWLNLLTYFSTLLYVVKYHLPSKKQCCNTRKYSHHIYMACMWFTAFLPTTSWWGSESYCVNISICALEPVFKMVTKKMFSTFSWLHTWRVEHSYISNTK